MIRLAAIVAFILAIIFYGFSISHGVWTYIIFALIGFLCLALDGFSWPRFPPRA